MLRVMLRRVTCPRDRSVRRCVAGSVVAACLAGSAVVMVAGGDRVGAVPASSAGRIVFASDQSTEAFRFGCPPRCKHGRYPIFVADSDGSHQRRITPKSWAASDPDISPDGTRVVFTVQRHGDVDLYVSNIDGSGRSQLTTTTGVDAVARVVTGRHPSRVRLSAQRASRGVDDGRRRRQPGAGDPLSDRLAFGTVVVARRDPDRLQRTSCRRHRRIPADRPLQTDLFVIDADGSRSRRV